MSDPVQLAIIAAVVAFIGGLPATLAALSALRQGKKNGDETAAVKHDVAALEVKVDGRLTQLIEEMRAKNLLEIKVATTTGFDEGQKIAEMAAKVHAADVAIARALPPIDPPLRPAVPPAHQVDRIEHTVVETGKDVKDVKQGVQMVEKHLGERVEEMASDLNAKLDEKKDK